MKKILMVMAAVVAMMLVAVGPASAAQKCHIGHYNVVVHHPAVTHVVHHDAVTQIVHHDAVTHVVHHEAVPAGPDLWWNWSPNKEQGPFDGPPAFPTDDRGTWEGPHENGGPSQDTYGTFQQGNGNGSWFHREHGTPAVDAWDETVVDQPAYDETVVVTEAYDETVVDSPAYITSKTVYVKVCKPTDKPKHHVTVTSTEKHAQTPAPVPTVIESGLAGTKPVSADTNNNDGLIMGGLIGLGLLLLCGGIVFSRRNN